MLKDKIKNPAFLVLIIVALVMGFALKTLMTKQKNDPMPEMKKANRELDEELIRKTEAAYDYAWQQGNIEGIMDCFAMDAVLISPRGDEACGAEQIRNLFRDLLRGEASSTKHTSRITRISFVTDDVAVVDGEAFIEGAENSFAAVKHHSFTDVLVRSEDGWLIAQIRAYAIEEI